MIYGRIRCIPDPKRNRRFANPTGSRRDEAREVRTGTRSVETSLQPPVVRQSIDFIGATET
jgi:hypothetical protein